MQGRGFEDRKSDGRIVIQGVGLLPTKTDRYGAE